MKYSLNFIRVFCVAILLPTEVKLSASSTEPEECTCYSHMRTVIVPVAFFIMIYIQRVSPLGKYIENRRN